MKRHFSWFAALMMLAGSSVLPNVWAQTGSPTTPAPGGPNRTGVTGTANPTQPTGRAGTTQPTGRPGTTQGTGSAGGTQGIGGVGTAATALDAAAAQIGQGFDAGFSRASSGDRFSTPGLSGRSPGVFVPEPSSGSIRNPVSALPGRPNFSGGTTGATFQPNLPIAGGANPGNQLFRPDALNGELPLRDLNRFGGATVSGFGASRIGVVPSVPQATQGTAGSTTAVSPAAPQVYVAPIVPLPAGAEADVQADPATTTISATPVPAQLRNARTATATAYPNQYPVTTTEDVVKTDSTRSTSAAASADFVEIIGGAEEPRTAGYRGEARPSSTRGLASVYPGYTLWQGYYWYHSPNAGWHYWDGNRWLRF